MMTSPLIYLLCFRAPYSNLNSFDFNLGVPPIRTMHGRSLSKSRDFNYENNRRGLDSRGVALPLKFPEDFLQLKFNW